MAIAFARSEYVSRSTGANACCKSSYNARVKIKDNKSVVTYNFSNRKDNVYHEILLPEHVDKKFKNVVVFSNEVERSEKKKNSQLYVEWVLALPKEEEVSLDLKIELVHEFIKRKGWVKEGLGVQVDIHTPHTDEKNWHAHLLVTTRRFTLDGNELGEKARDLQPEVKNGRVQKTIEIDNNIFWREVQNDVFKAHGLDIRVDLNGERTQEHIGPKRMRSILNQAVDRNEITRIANMESLKNSDSVLDRITSHYSVFTKEEIKKLLYLVHEPDTANALFEETIGSDRLELLYDDEAVATKYYTTKEVRDEELKLMRLSEYVRGRQNILGALIGKSEWQRQLQDSKESTNLSKEQENAITQLLLGEGGIRILRGRAGTGKSHVLGSLARIAKNYGVHVIGLSPTHKAKEELIKVGYNGADTVKAMLFKLYNGKFYLPKNSLLVVDEAGMIGNDDYIELFRVAASKQCNVILSGDERQIASIQRGGMFETFAEEFGSTTLFDIKRQVTQWGREVATSFANGDVARGISILEEQNRIIENADKVESAEKLLRDWNASEANLLNKIILAVKNKDVDLLNIGARQYLKANGTLRGAEIAVNGKCFMNGDLIVIKTTMKDLGLVNGDRGKLLKVSEKEFVLELLSHNEETRGKKISFNPKQFSGFNHAYATTIFKAQAASIFEVFVFHDGFAGLRNSYVALSRHIKELRLYINTQATKSLNHLICQMSIDPEISSSLGYFTKDELEKKYSKDPNDEKGLLASLISTGAQFFRRKALEFKDKHIPDWAYYNYEAMPLDKAHVEKVLDSSCIQEETLTATHIDGNLAIEVKGRDFALKGPKLTPKQRFYDKADYARKDKAISDLVSKRAMWDRENEQLKHEAKFRADEIARELLGNPNTKLSNNKTLRFGDNGKIAVRISGDKAGQWYDFSEDKGGDIFALVRETVGGDFKSSAEYLKNMLGIRQSPNLYLVEKHRNSNLTEKHIKEKEALAKEESAKRRQVEKLISSAKPVTRQTLAYRYLLEHRGITCVLSKDLMTTGIKVKLTDVDKSEYVPTLLAFARDKNGEITGGQQIFLDKDTASKANLELPKRSFGKIAGSFVYLDEVALATKSNNADKSTSSITLVENERNSCVTIIAEGLETALSVKQALNNPSTSMRADIKVLCSLGISNIRNYAPYLGEKIIIASDNDGKDALTSKTIENAKEILIQRGAFVEVVTPPEMGDFNDVIREQNGETKIRDTFSQAILKHSARSLDEFFYTKEEGKSLDNYLDSQEQKDLSYIRQYGISEMGIIEAYRGNSLNGKVVLEEMRKHIDFARSQTQDYKNIIEEAEEFGYKSDEKEITRAIIGMDGEKSLRYISDLRDQSIREYLDNKLSVFDIAKSKGATIEEAKKIFSQEQNFLLETGSKLLFPLSLYGEKIVQDLTAVEKISKAPHLLEASLKLADELLDNKILPELDIAKILCSSRDAQTIKDKLEISIEKHKLYTVPQQLVKKRSKAGTISAALVLLQKEQVLYSNMQKNIKHYSSDKELAEKCHLAAKYEKEGICSSLKHVVGVLRALKEISEDTLLSDLRDTKDIKDTYLELDVKLEAIEINKTIISITTAKEKATTMSEVVSAIEKSEDYFVSLENDIKYKENITSTLISLTKTAKKNKQDNTCKELNKLSEFMQESKGFVDHAPAIRALKSSSNTKEAYNNLLKTYHSYFITKVHTGLEHINSGKTLFFDKQQWSNPQEFLDHVIKTGNKDYMPHKELNVLRNNIIDRQKHMEIDGPDLR